MNCPEPLSLGPPTIKVQPWIDPVVEAHGFTPTSCYVESCWLPVLGPTTTWLYRQLGTRLARSPEGIEVSLPQLARGLGLGAGTGRRSLVATAIGRLGRFGIARWDGEAMLVRRVIGPLTARQLALLPEFVQESHERLISERRSHGPA